MRISDWSSDVCSSDLVDAALSERTFQHADVDTAPGAPINPRSAVAHQDAIRTAISQLSRGEPVALPESIHSAEFLRTADERSDERREGKDGVSKFRFRWQKDV